MQDNDIKKTLQSLDIPSPSENAKKQVLESAAQAFAAHQEEKRQGFAKTKRPIFSPTKAWEKLIGRFTMQKAYVFVGSMAAIATVLAITTTHYSTIMSPVMIQPEDRAAILSETLQQEPAQAKKPEAKLARSMDMVASPSLRGKEEPEQASASSDMSAPPMEMAVPAPAPPMAAPAPPAKMMEKKKAIATNKPVEMNKDFSALLKSIEKAPQERRLEDKKSAMREKAYNGSASPAIVNQFQKSEALSRQASDNIIAYQADGSYPQAQVYNGGDNFEKFAENPVKLVKNEPVSTFSLDVDTSSYSFVRRLLNEGTLPPKDAVRIEEMINYFDYHYSVPESREVPFKPTITVYPTPWNKDTKLVHIGIKGYDINKAEKPRSNLVFLIDVSGSMNTPDRLPLVKSALRMLLDQLQPDDTVGIVVYAGNVGTVLEPTKIAEKAKIVEAIERLSAGGSTAGGEGIRQAYALAEQHFDKKAVNRVILSTDGDFNVGITNPTQLQEFIEQKRDSGIFLSILGVGKGNYNDALMQKLAQNGNGTAAYMDNLNEARKLLVEEAGATLFTIAKDVKVQVEFNPEMVSEYRLIGYESRLLKREDFNNDKIDAGDVGSGHAVTAIYEITPAGGKTQVDDLRYGKEDVEKVEKKSSAHSNEYAFLKIRYKLPDAQESKLLTTPINASQEVRDIKQVSDDVRFSTAVAGFGQLLKGDTHIKSYSYDDVLSLADGARGKDTFGYRAEFLNMVRLAKTESGMQPPVSVPIQQE